MEMKGIEPLSVPCKGTSLPLAYTPFQSECVTSQNPSSPYQGQQVLCQR